jgi:hypothetical protein
MKKEKKIFDLPSLSTLEGKELSLNDLGDLEYDFCCSSGCERGCSEGVGAVANGTPSSGKCE